MTPDELARLVQALQPAGAAGGRAWPVVASGSVGLRLVALWPAALRARVVPAAGDSMDGALQLVRAVVDSAD